MFGIGLKFLYNIFQVLLFLAVGLGIIYLLVAGMKRLLFFFAPRIAEELGDFFQTIGKILVRKKSTKPRIEEGDQATDFPKQ